MIHAEPKYTGKFKIQSESVTEVLTRHEVIARVTALMGEVDGREAAAIERAVKLGWYLLQMHEQLIGIRGSWYQFLREIKIHEKTAQRRMRTAALFGNSHGVTDTEAVLKCVENYEYLAGVQLIAAGKLPSVNQLEIASGLRAPEQNSSRYGTAVRASESVRSVPPVQNSSTYGTAVPASDSVRSVTPNAPVPLDEVRYGRPLEPGEEIESYGDGDDEPVGGWGNDDFGGDVEDDLPPPAPIVQAPAKPIGAAGVQMTFDAVYDAAMARIATRFTEFRTASMSTKRRNALRYFAEDMEAKLKSILQEVP